MHRVPTSGDILVRENMSPRRTKSGTEYCLKISELIFLKLIKPHINKM